MPWIDVAVTLLIAALSGMGIGSGGLMVLYLTLLRDVPQLRAQGVNLLFFLFAAGASMAVHLRRRRVRLLPSVLMIAAGLPFAYLGSHLAALFPEQLVRKLFGVFLVLVGLGGLFGTRQPKKDRNIPKNIQKVLYKR